MYRKEYEFIGTDSIVKPYEGDIWPIDGDIRGGQDGAICQKEPEQWNMTL